MDWLTREGMLIVGRGRERGAKGGPAASGSKLRDFLALVVIRARGHAHDARSYDVRRALHANREGLQDTVGVEGVPRLARHSSGGSGGHLLPRELVHQPRHDTGVETPGQLGAVGNVGHHAHAHGPLQLRSNLLVRRHRRWQVVGAVPKGSQILTSPALVA